MRVGGGDETTEEMEEDKRQPKHLHNKFKREEKRTIFQRKISIRLKNTNKPARLREERRSGDENKAT